MSKELLYLISIFLIFNLLIFIKINSKLTKLSKSILQDTQNINDLKKIINNHFFNTKTKKLIKSEISNNLVNKDYNEKNDIFNEDTKQYYKKLQKLFCQDNNIFMNPFVEKEIKAVKIDINKISFKMFVYRKNDRVSNSILINKNYDLKGIINILNALDYYSKKNKIKKKNIYILDIGANIGWFSLIIGKNGYNVIAFEPSQTNYYILKKNFCLNKELDITLINKGIYNEEKNCTLYYDLLNVGDGILFCGNNKFNQTNYYFENIKLTKLSNYITYLKDKNLAFIKIDVEGSELKAIESGIDLIIKYHIPFIYLEFNQILLKKNGSSPELLLRIFQNNGYQFSIIDFLSKNYLSIEDLIKNQFINIYIIYSGIIE